MLIPRIWYEACQRHDAMSETPPAKSATSLQSPAPRVAFISHTTPDDGYVAELESLLRSSGFDQVFNDVHSIQPDERFWPTIEHGIRDCDVFYVVITLRSISPGTNVSPQKCCGPSPSMRRIFQRADRNWVATPPSRP